MGWLTQTSMMSPKEERVFWLAELARRYQLGYGMAVNCKHGPSLKRTPVLRKLVEDGLVVRLREARGGSCNRTVLMLAPPPESETLLQHTA